MWRPLSLTSVSNCRTSRDQAQAEPARAFYSNPLLSVTVLPNTHTSTHLAPSYFSLLAIHYNAKVKYSGYLCLILQCSFKKICRKRPACIVNPFLFKSGPKRCVCTGTYRYLLYFFLRHLWFEDIYACFMKRSPVYFFMFCINENSWKSLI